MSRISVLFLFLFLCFVPSLVAAEESYIDVTVMTIPNWTVRQMQTFSGAAPSRAWVFAKNDEEVMVSAMNSEGIASGLLGQETSSLVKIYADALIAGWGGKSKGPDAGTNASFCAGEAGYKAEATFGDRVFDYYFCMMINADHSRTVTFVTWGSHGMPEMVAAKRLMTFVQATTINVVPD